MILVYDTPTPHYNQPKLVVRLYLSLVDRPIALAPKIVGLAIDQTIVDMDTFRPHLVHRVGKS